MRSSGATWFVMLALGAALPVACSGVGGLAGPDADAGSDARRAPAVEASAPSGEAPDSARSGSPPECTGPADCPSKVCRPEGICALATLSDGVQNNDETDIDCGGISHKLCDDGKKCLTAHDCASAVCKDLGEGQGPRCQAPTSTDLVRNGGETDIDCGGGHAPPCANGQRCVARTDCASSVCVGGACIAPTIDGVKNGTETDIDCGGPTAPTCLDGSTCLVGSDCVNAACVGGRCTPPSPTDGVKNGTETDVDCGGGAAPKCGATKACAVHADCASDGCAYNFRCARRPSCTPRNGGDTCGRGEVGQVGAAHESCCATAPVPDAATHLGKYGVTAGRMRVFLDRVGGDVRGFVQSARAAGRIPAEATLLPSWDPYLPVSFAGTTDPAELAEGSQSDPTAPIPGVYTSVYRHLGGFIFRDNTLPLTGCYIDGPGTHTYWMSPQIEAQYMGDVPHAYGQDILDTKALNCVNYLLGQAFCVWDGGRLQLRQEYDAAWGAALYPWGDTPVPYGPGSATWAGNRFPTATDASLRAAGSPFAPGPTQSMQLANFLFSYEYPNLIGADYAAFIGAPGRLGGRSANGHSLNDGVMELTSTVIEPNPGLPAANSISWSRNGSYEGHSVGARFVANLVTKYGKLGMRCAYDAP